MCERFWTLPFRGTDVVEVLERVGREVGLPTTIRVDQGTEFVSRDLDLWAYQRGVSTSRGQESRQTMHSLRPSMADSEPSVSNSLVPEP
jgi:transposase InsO family protein